MRSVHQLIWYPGSPLTVQPSVCAATKSQKNLSLYGDPAFSLAPKYTEAEAVPYESNVPPYGDAKGYCEPKSLRRRARRKALIRTIRLPRIQAASRENRHLGRLCTFGTCVVPQRFSGFDRQGSFSWQLRSTVQIVACEMSSSFDPSNLWNRVFA